MFIISGLRPLPPSVAGSEVGEGDDTRKPCSFQQMYYLCIDKTHCLAEAVHKE